MQNGSKIILNKGKNLSFFCCVLEIVLKLLYNAVVRRCDGMVDVLDSKSSVLWTWGFESPHRHQVGASFVSLAPTFFQKSERTHTAAPPFQPRPAYAVLASDDENGSDMNY